MTSTVGSEGPEAPIPSLRKPSKWPIEFTVLIGLLIVVGGAWVFVALAGAVRKDSLKEFDDSILKLVRDPANESKLRGPPWVAEIARDITGLGGYAILSLLVSSVCGFLLLLKKRVAVRFIIVSVLGGFVLSLGLKEIFERPRPDLVEHLSYVATSSFPSGHSMMSAVVYLTLGSLLSRFAEGHAIRVYCLAVAILLTGLVGCSRVMMGVHYPTDVLGGWTAGLVWATLCWLVARRFQQTHPISAPPPEATGN